MLIDKLIAHKALKKIGKQLINNNCKILGDKASQEILPNIILAKESDYITEHLAPVLNVKIVKNIDEAIRHINHYGSGHTDAIITENKNCAAHFLKNVDSAICMHNTSTQFADGGEFGFGAEIGIATGRLHARGPVGAKHLTTYKYQVTDKRADSIKSLGLKKRMEINHIEKKMNIQYSVQMIKALKVRSPNTKFIFLMGADNLSQFTEWKSWKEITLLVPIAVVARPGYGLKSQLSPTARYLSDHRVPEHKAHTLKYESPPTWTFITPPLNKNSSSAIRKDIANA